MWYPVFGMMHIKEPLLLFGKSSPCSGSSWFPLSLRGPLPYVRYIKYVKCMVKALGQLEMH